MDTTHDGGSKMTGQPARIMGSRCGVPLAGNLNFKFLYSTKNVEYIEVVVQLRNLESIQLARYSTDFQAVFCVGYVGLVRDQPGRIMGSHCGVPLAGNLNVNFFAAPQRGEYIYG